MTQISINSLMNKSQDYLDIQGEWKSVLGNPDKGGFWYIQGKEKNGKTTTAINLSVCLSKTHKVTYVSGEEGFSSHLQNIVSRQDIDRSSRNLKFSEYKSINAIEKLIEKRRSSHFWVIDNVTIYKAQLSVREIHRLLNKYKHKVFIFIAHEEKGEPHTAAAKEISRFAKIRFLVEGLKCVVAGRCPGGEMIIESKTARLHHSTKPLQL